MKGCDPCDGELGGCNAFLVCDSLELVDKLQVMSEDLWVLEPGVVGTHVVFGNIVDRFELSGQEATAKGTIDTFIRWLARLLMVEMERTHMQPRSHPALRQWRGLKKIGQRLA